MEPSPYNGRPIPETKYPPRPYQLAAIMEVEKGWQDEEISTQLVVSATGTGKTVLFSIMARMEEQSGLKTLILAHTDELVNQAIEKLYKSTGLVAQKEKAHEYASRYAKIVVGSVQTMSGRLRLMSWPNDHFGLVVVDEAHRSLAKSYQTVLDHFLEGGARIVGVTATADRGDKRALGEFYQKVAYDYGLLKACRDGWLVRPIVKTMPLSIDLRGVKTKKTVDGADFDRAEVGKRLVPFMQDIARAIKRERPEGKIIIFLPSVETAQLMSDAMNDAGIISEWVCGDVKLCPDRKDRIQRYQNGTTRCICNMAILTEGFDCDDIDTLVVLRPTKIRSLYAQMVGRGTRPLGQIIPALSTAANALERQQIIKGSSKPVLTILDFLWLYEKHDLVRPASLVSKSPEVEEQMGQADGDLVEAEERAERDLLDKLQRELARHGDKQSKVIDPLANAVDLGDVEISDYTPPTPHAASQPTERQIRTLERNGIDVAKVKSKGHAGALIARILQRHGKGLCTVRQMTFLSKLGYENTAMMTQAEASEIIRSHGGVE